ncbi:MAG TPA: LysM peptidoglycan-binding domain-containing protein [Thermoanaerobaculia bacterium]|nr:LysM peptidoglycan-binding domain-containing protein [Thermoanaerobaculia bacterium]
MAPVLLLAVTVAAWADGPQSLTATSTAPTTTTTIATTTTATTSSTTTTTTAKTTAAPAKKTARKAKSSSAKHATSASSKRESSRPPRELHMVRNHWTAYNPPDPATYPPTAKSYEIKQGDTLSGIARQQYGNANLWPQLWESNTWITDAHWIYPGDVLLVQGEGANAAVSTQTTTTTTTATGTTTTGAETLTGGEAMTHAPEQEPGTTGLTAAEIHRERPPIPLGAEGDVYCYGYIGDPNESMPNRVASYEDVEMMVEASSLGPGSPGVTGDLLFINGGTSSGLVAGETYMVVEPGDMIVHPVSGAVIGQHYDFEGQIRVLCADATHARGQIVQNCREIHPGARLKPMPQLPIPIARVPDVPGFCDPSTNRAVGFIVGSQGWYEALGEGNLVEVNLGQADQVQPGDFLTVYRDVPGKARQILGEIGVLTTQPHTATGRIVAMRRAMLIGDQVEAR